MRALAILGLSALLFAAPALAKPTVIPLPNKDVDSIVIPEGSPLHFKRFDKEGIAYFEGKVTLTGTYYYGDNEYNDENDAEPTLYFIFDKKSAALLPSYKTRGRPDSIAFYNEGQLVDALFSEADRKHARTKGAKYLTGKIRLVVDKFQVGIECDAPFFNARFVSIAQPALKLAANDLPDTGC